MEGKRFFEAFKVFVVCLYYSARSFLATVGGSRSFSGSICRSEF
jgi:hypothetical protein